MWRVEQLRATSVELDFSSSGQGSRAATAIDADGERIFNAIELISVERSTIQVIVCECCGFSHCEPGGWVNMRRLGNNILWTPAWDMMATGAWEHTEYRPPSFFGSRGAPMFGSDSWNRLRKFCETLPCFDALPALDSREAALLCQLSAPGRVLGEFPAVPKFLQDAIIAVTDGDAATESRAIDQCLQDYHSNPQQMVPVPPDVPVAPIELWLDLPGTPGWTAFARVGEVVCCMLEDDLTVAVGAG